MLNILKLQNELLLLFSFSRLVRVFLVLKKAGNHLALLSAARLWGRIGYSTGFEPTVQRDRKLHGQLGSGQAQPEMVPTEQRQGRCLALRTHGERPGDFLKIKEQQNPQIPNCQFYFLTRIEIHKRITFSKCSAIGSRFFFKVVNFTFFCLHCIQRKVQLLTEWEGGSEA